MIQKQQKPPLLPLPQKKIRAKAKLPVAIDS